ATLTFDQVTSSGGCTTETSGQFVVLTARNNPDLQDVALLLGSRVTNCSDGSSSYDTYAAQGTGDYRFSGLASASFSGTLSELSTGEAIVINVSWAGTGSVTHVRESFHSHSGGVTLDYFSQQQRHANLSGSVTLGGVGASIADGMVLSEVDGDLV